MEPGVRPAGQQPDNHAVVLGQQFLGNHLGVLERGQLLGEAVERGPGLVGLAVDDLVVVDDVEGQVIRQVAQPMAVDDAEQVLDGLLVGVGGRSHRDFPLTLTS
jgi:hypothetical protein